MEIKTLSASSFTNHDGCPHNWFIEYNLYWRGEANQKTEQGTVVHNVLEILAQIKQARDQGLEVVQTEIMGELSVTDFDIDHIIFECFEYQKKITNFDWSVDKNGKPFDWLASITELVYMVRDYGKGAYWPLNLKIIQPEQYFKLEIKEDWAKLDDGYLALTGKIDLIYEEDGFYHLLDYKSGATRKDWNTGKVKELADFEKDIQLLMYRYALSRLYPDKEVIVTIFFIQAGGPFTVAIDLDNMDALLERIKKKFLEIKTTIQPKLKKSWKCTRFCDHGKSTFEDSTLEPLIEFRDGQFTQPGQLMTRCQQTEYMLKTRGIEWTLQNMQNQKKR